MSLAPLKFMLDCQLSRCEDHFYAALMITGLKDRHLRKHHLEGTLSDAWQSYCLFVRYVLIRSSVGSTTATGVVLPPSIVPATWERVSHVVVRASKSKPPQVGQVNNLLIKEPTWGDSSKIVPLILALAPANAANLLGFLGGGLQGPKHCQIVRNACAHRNTQTCADVDALSTQYIASRVRHPTDAMTWMDPATGEFAFLMWIEDMRTIAHGAVQ